ncbi:hypothetical protein ACF07Z_28545 [Streptomyces albidoflavus]
MKLNKFLAVILSTTAAVAVLAAGGNAVAAPAGFGWDVVPQNAPISTLL